MSGRTSDDGSQPPVSSTGTGAQNWFRQEPSHLRNCAVQERWASILRTSKMVRPDRAKRSNDTAIEAITIRGRLCVRGTARERAAAGVCDTVERPLLGVLVPHDRIGEREAFAAAEGDPRLRGRREADPEGMAACGRSLEGFTQMQCSRVFEVRQC